MGEHQTDGARDVNGSLIEASLRWKRCGVLLSSEVLEEIIDRRPRSGGYDFSQQGAINEVTNTWKKKDE